jgi:hypothetical protein
VGELTRLEISLKRTKATLAGITKLANPFKPLSLVAYPGCMSGKSYDPLWTLFLNVCEDCGEKTALAHLNKADQKISKDRLTKEGKTDWWKPDYVWQGILAAIMGLEQVKGFNPTINGVIGNEPPPCE